MMKSKNADLSEEQMETIKSTIKTLCKEQLEEFKKTELSEIDQLRGILLHNSPSSLEAN